jgi:hypothetical protein
MEVIENRDYFFDPENGGKQMTTKENQLWKSRFTSV